MSDRERADYAARLLRFGLVFPFRMSASSTQRFTAASSFTEADCSWGGLTKPERESTDGSAVSRFVGDGNGRQITTLFFARATGQESWMLTNATELVLLFQQTSFSARQGLPEFELRKAHCMSRRFTFRNQAFNNCDQVLRRFAGAYMSICDG